jgi:hypothetical protein
MFLCSGVRVDLLITPIRITRKIGYTHPLFNLIIYVLRHRERNTHTHTHTHTHIHTNTHPTRTLAMVIRIPYGKISNIYLSLKRFKCLQYVVLSTLFTYSVRHRISIDVLY